MEGGFSEISIIPGGPIAKDLLVAFALTAALLACLYLISLLSKEIFKKIQALKETSRLALKLQATEILSAGKVSFIVIRLAKLIRLAITLILLYAYILLLLGIFPQTQAISRTIAGHVMPVLRDSVMAVKSYLPNLLFLALIVFLTRYLIKAVRFVFTAIGKEKVKIPGFYPEWARPTFVLVRLLIIALAVAIVFPYLPGSASPAFRGISIFLGVLISLGSTAALGNIVAGFYLTYTRAFGMGDRVRIADTEGDVIEKSLLATHINTIKNVKITIPNSQVLASHIINYSASAKAKEEGLILHAKVTIGYDVPWRKVHELLIDAARGVEHLMETPPPFVLQTSLDNHFASYELNVHTDKPRQMASIYSALHQNIQDKFNAAGVEIASPVQAAIRDMKKKPSLEEAVRPEEATHVPG